MISITEFKKVFIKLFFLSLTLNLEPPKQFH